MTTAINPTKTDDTNCYYSFTTLRLKKKKELQDNNPLRTLLAPGDPLLTESTKRHAMEGVSLGRLKTRDNNLRQFWVDLIIGVLSLLLSLGK